MRRENRQLVYFLFTAKTRPVDATRRTHWKKSNMLAKFERTNDPEIIRPNTWRSGASRIPQFLQALHVIRFLVSSGYCLHFLQKICVEVLRVGLVYQYCPQCWPKSAPRRQIFENIFSERIDFLIKFTFWIDFVSIFWPWEISGRQAQNLGSWWWMIHNLPSPPPPLLWLLLQSKSIFKNFAVNPLSPFMNFTVKPLFSISTCILISEFYFGAPVIFFSTLGLERVCHRQTETDKDDVVTRKSVLGGLLYNFWKQNVCAPFALKHSDHRTMEVLKSELPELKTHIGRKQSHRRSHTTSVRVQTGTRTHSNSIRNCLQLFFFVVIYCHLKKLSVDQTPRLCNLTSKSYSNIVRVVVIW